MRHHRRTLSRPSNVSDDLAHALIELREACGEMQTRAQIEAWNKAERALDLWRASRKPKPDKGD